MTTGGATMPAEVRPLAEAVKEKLAIQELQAEERTRRMNILKSMDTRAISEQLPMLEAKLQETLKAELAYRKDSQGYMASGSQDCAEVKRLLAELAVNAEGKTVAEREAWLTRQRAVNPQLAGAISRQNQVAFQLEDFRIQEEAIRVQMTNIRAILELKTAQIQFLAS